MISEDDTQKKKTQPPNSARAAQATAPQARARNNVTGGLRQRVRQQLTPTVYTDDSGVKRYEGRMIGPGGRSRPDRIGVSGSSGLRRPTTGTSGLSKDANTALGELRGLGVPASVQQGRVVLDDAALEQLSNDPKLRERVQSTVFGAGGALLSGEMGADGVPVYSDANRSVERRVAAGLLPDPEQQERQRFENAHQARRYANASRIGNLRSGILSPEQAAAEQEIEDSRTTLRTNQFNADTARLEAQSEMIRNARERDSRIFRDSQATADNFGAAFNEYNVRAGMDPDEAARRTSVAEQARYNTLVNQFRDTNGRSGIDPREVSPVLAGQMSAFAANASRYDSVGWFNAPAKGLTFEDTMQLVTDMAIADPDQRKFSFGGGTLDYGDNDIPAEFKQSLNQMVEARRNYLIGEATAMASQEGFNPSNLGDTDKAALEQAAKAYRAQVVAERNARQSDRIQGLRGQQRDQNLTLEDMNRVNNITGGLRNVDAVAEANEVARRNNRRTSPDLNNDLPEEGDDLLNWFAEQMRARNQEEGQ